MDYFKSTLILRNKYDFGKILRANSVIPETSESSFKLDQFLDAFKKELNVKPATACFFDEATNKQYMGELHVCFNKQFDLIDCDFKPADKFARMKRNVVDGKGEVACNQTMPIYYPAK